MTMGDDVEALCLVKVCRELERAFEKKKLLKDGGDCSHCGPTHHLHWLPWWRPTLVTSGFFLPIYPERFPDGKLPAPLSYHNY